MPVPQTSVLPLNYSRHVWLLIHQNQDSDELSGGNCGTTTLDYQGYCWIGRGRRDVLPAHEHQWFGSDHIF